MHGRWWDKREHQFQEVFGWFGAQLGGRNNWSASPDGRKNHHRKIIAPAGPKSNRPASGTTRPELTARSAPPTVQNPGLAAAQPRVNRTLTSLSAKRDCPTAPRRDTN